jgi:hypothetical protein
MTRTVPDHVCAKQAICFECFKAGMERARARREAWAQRSLPFEAAPAALSPRAIAHRRQMLEHLSRIRHA